MSDSFATVHWDPAADEDHDGCPVCAGGLLTDPEAYGRALAGRVYERIVNGTAGSPAPRPAQSGAKGATAKATKATAKKASG